MFPTGITDHVSVHYKKAVFAYNHDPDTDGIFRATLPAASIHAPPSTGIGSANYGGDIAILPKKGFLQCYRLDYTEYCFRTKWHEKQLSCVSNPFSANLYKDMDWHHYVVTKKAVLLWDGTYAGLLSTG